MRSRAEIMMSPRPVALTCFEREYVVARDVRLCWLCPTDSVTVDPKKVLILFTKHLRFLAPHWRPTVFFLPAILLRRRQGAMWLRCGAGSTVCCDAATAFHEKPTSAPRHGAGRRTEWLAVSFGLLCTSFLAWRCKLSGHPHRSCHFFFGNTAAALAGDILLLNSECPSNHAGSVRGSFSEL